VNRKNELEIENLFLRIIGPFFSRLGRHPFTGFCSIENSTVNTSFSKDDGRKIVHTVA